MVFQIQQKKLSSYINMNVFAIRKVREELRAIKNEVVSGKNLERRLNLMLASLGSNDKFHIEDNIDDCSYEDEVGKVNEFYIHVDLGGNEYVDMQCIINNFEDGKDEWLILVKDIISNEGGI